MYRNQHNNSFRNRNNNSFSNSHNRRRNGSSYGQRGRQNTKQLDSRLFVKKAQQTIGDTEYLSGKTFSDLPLSDKLKRNIASHGYNNQTAIQDKTIPAIIEGRDVIGIANTGTGKTAAFLIPLVNKAESNRNERVLIVAPTRELAMQIVDELNVFTTGMNLESVLCIGGASMFRQEQKLRHNPHFVIGTPGRLRDLIERRRLNLNLFRSVVLDEVDRMVDIGFIQDVKYFISLLPIQRQSLFFSATVSDKVQGIVRSFVNNPVTVSVKQQDTAENVDQDVIKVSKEKKLEALHDLLVKDGFNKVLIFGRTKWGIEKLTHSLVSRGFKATALHGNKSQGQRQRALSQFKQNEINILLATDVASRGLDIDNVTHVINYDAPASYDDYIHRIGRTGRAGKKGTAFTFIE